MTSRVGCSTSRVRSRETSGMIPRLFRVGGVLLLLVLLYVGVTFIQVWRASRHDGARPAQAIIVLGAAQYDGRPSPVLRARLDHVVELYADDIAPLVVVTGGSKQGDRFTEAEASAAYLSDQGVPGGAIERETTGSTSYESLAATARFLRERDVTDVVLVSDPFHAYRIGAISREVGMRAAVSPTPSSAVGGQARWRHLLRETGGVSVGRVIGYRRLDHVLGQDL
ncbi:MAG TPA: YdcF family protein [Euzebyales bacterium]|nr:YdcF family protein [Euzebyales bacterium]